jgi:polyvinyl alcohol dehydrogenase (cytochrome)
VEPQRPPAGRRLARHIRPLAVALVGTALALASCTPKPPTGGGGSWSMAGYDAKNSRFAANEKAISAANVGTLKPKWALDTKGDVAATPAVKDGVVYFPDFGGYLNAVDAKTGTQIWQKKVSEATGFEDSQVRTTPVFYNDLLIVGEVKHHSHGEEPGGEDPGDDHGEHEHAAALADPPPEHGDHGDHGGTPTTTTTRPVTSTTRAPAPTTTRPGTPTTVAPTTAAPTTAAPTTAPPTTMPGGDDHHGNGGGGEDHDNPNAPGHPVNVLAFNTKTGNLVWKTAVDQHAASIITSNPTIAGSRIVVGVSSSEEDKAESSDYHCCSFRGSLVSLNARTGALLWKTYTVPANPTDKRCTTFDSASQDFKGCADSGVAVWNTPAIDVLKNTAYFATGNNYTVTDAEFECAKAAKAAGTSNANCPAAGNLIESIIAVDLLTGRIKWTRKLGGFDAWNYQCLYNPGATWCPGPYGTDYDFGSNTNLITTTINGVRRDLVGVGQKSGIYWAVDANTGQVVWNTLVGPGSFLGGIEWGTAYDGKYIYAGNGNLSGTVHTLQPSGVQHDGGSWTALDPATGKIVWQTPSKGAKPNGALGAVSVANGVVFGGAISPSGDNMFAMDAASGKPLWSFAAGGSVNSGPSIVDGMVFWGAGYEHFAAVGMNGAKKLYAFSLNGQ